MSNCQGDRCLGFSVMCLVSILGGVVAPVAHAAPGGLQGIGADGEPRALPLQRTSIHVEVSAFVAAATIEQVFVNPFEEPIEATYRFPLNPGADVNGFELQNGLRVTRGEIQERAEAQQTYEAARAEGYSAALLEQDPGAMFTQSIANLLPGNEVRVRLELVQTAKYDAGTYQLTLPLAEPGEATENGALTAPAACGPPMELVLSVAAGVPVHGVSSSTHRIVMGRESEDRVRVTALGLECSDEATFRLSWNVAADDPEIGLLTHRPDGAAHGYFTLLLQPKGVVAPDEAMPKEVLFVLDTSGSMSGVPLNLSTKFVTAALETLGPRDRFNLIRFAGVASVFAKEAVDNEPENVRRATGWIRELESGGGTQMLTGLRKAIEPFPDPERFRMIFFLTDGHIGDGDGVLSAIDRMPSDVSAYTIGIGGAAHALLSEIAERGRGVYLHLAENGSAEAALDRFRGWVTRPYLTDVRIDWDGLPVEPLGDADPHHLFSGQTLSLVGRYFGGAEGTVRLSGRLGGAPWERAFDVTLPERVAEHAALATVWAGRRVDELLAAFEAPGLASPEAREKVVQLALKHGLVTDFTSFVAVDYAIRAHEGGETSTVDARTGECIGEVDEAEDLASEGERREELIRLPSLPERPVTSGLAVAIADSAGQPLPGAVVNVVGGGIALSTQTGGDGVARFPTVTAGGGYTVEASFPGFAIMRITQLTVSPGGSLVTLPLSAEQAERVKVVASEPVVDLDDFSSLTKFSDEYVSGLPVPGRFYQNVLTLAPGVNDPAGGGNPIIHGSRTRDFRASVAGALNVDPFTGEAVGLINPSSIEEMEVITGGASVEFGRAQGGFANIVQKQGTNDFEGTLQLTADNLGSTTDALAPTGYHGDLSLSGPIVRDRVWFEVGGILADEERLVDAGPSPSTTATVTDGLSARLTVQASPRNKLQFGFAHLDERRERAGISTFVQPDATRDSRRRSDRFQLNWTVPLTTRVLIDSTLSYIDGDQGVGPTGIDRPLERCGATTVTGDECTDLFVGEIRGAAPRRVTESDRRWSLGSKATVYAGQLAGATHQLKLGAVWNVEDRSRTVDRAASLVTGRLGDLVQVEGGDVTGSFTARRDGASTGSAEARSSSVSVFVEDQIKPLSSLTIDLGLRVDREQVDAGRPAGTDLTLHAGEGASASQLESTNLSPQASIAWDPWTDGRTEFSLAGRRYFDALRTEDVLLRAEPVALDSILETGGLSEIDTSPRPSVYRVDPGLRSPSTDEWILSFARELFTETSIRVELIHRRAREQRQDREVNHRQADLGACLPGVPLGRSAVSAVGGGDGLVDDCTGALLYDATRAAWVQAPDGVPDAYAVDPDVGDVFVLGNFAEGTTRAFRLILERRMYRAFEFQARYEWTDSTNTAELYDPSRDDEQGLLEDREGPAGGVPRHAASFAAVWLTPWGLRFGTVVRWQSGLPVSDMERRYLLDPLAPGEVAAQGFQPRLVYTDGRNTRNDPATFWVDLRFEKALSLGQGTLQLSAEVFNVLDERPLLSTTTTAGYARTLQGFRDAERATGRRVQLGMTYEF